MNSVWIVDDDQSIRFVLEKALAKQQLKTVSFTNVKDALKALDKAVPNALPAVLLSDIRMPEASGISLLKTVKEKHPQIPVIIMTAYSDLDSTVSAFQSGAFEYISKPFDLNAVVDLVKRGINESKHYLAPEKNVCEIGGADDGLIGHAPAMQEVFRVIGRLSQSNATVLITGESGTGKELIAKALHQHSLNSQGPFVAINTAAIPKDLLESELFGHEKGAFTGAQTMRSGRFEQAAGGSLFLDEIGDMSLDLQTRLLRVLSDGRFYRVGGKDAITSDVRVIAATHQNLEAMVKQGVFREDLFHRLNVIRLRLPSLNERKEDIPDLVHHFLKKSAQQQGGVAKNISVEALQALKQFTYTGNVRQLENMCHWLTVMTPTQTIQFKDLPPEVLQEVEGSRVEETLPISTIVVGRSSFSSTHEAYGAEQDAVIKHSSTETPNTHASSQEGDPIKSWLEQLDDVAIEMLEKGEADVWKILTQQLEARLIKTALSTTQGKRIEAANRLGIGRNTITRKIQELGLDENPDQELDQSETSAHQ